MNKKIKIISLLYHIDVCVCSSCMLPMCLYILNFCLFWITKMFMLTSLAFLRCMISQKTTKVWRLQNDKIRKLRKQKNNNKDQVALTQFGSSKKLM